MADTAGPSGQAGVELPPPPAPTPARPGGGWWRCRASWRSWVSVRARSSCTLATPIRRACPSRSDAAPGATRAAAPSSPVAADMAMAPYATYVAGADLPALGGSGPAYRLAGAVSEAGRNGPGRVPSASPARRRRRAPAGASPATGACWRSPARVAARGGSAARSPPTARSAAPPAVAWLPRRGWVDRSPPSPWSRPPRPTRVSLLRRLLRTRRPRSPPCRRPPPALRTTRALILASSSRRSPRRRTCRRRSRPVGSRSTWCRPRGSRCEMPTSPSRARSRSGT